MPLQRLCPGLCLASGARLLLLQLLLQLGGPVLQLASGLCLGVQLCSEPREVFFLLGGPVRLGRRHLLRGCELFLRGALLRVRLLQTRPRPVSELRHVLSQPGDVLRLLGEERLELVLLVVSTTAHGGELLFRVLELLARLRGALLALSRPLQCGVSLSPGLRQLCRALFSGRRELGAEGCTLSFRVAGLCLELL